MSEVDGRSTVTYSPQDTLMVEGVPKGEARGVNSDGERSRCPSSCLV